MAKKLNKGSPPRPTGKVPSPDQPHDDFVRFSFKYLEIDHQEFSLPSGTDKPEYLGLLFDRLKQISTMRCQEFRQAGKVLRSHQISWAKTSQPDGYAHLPEQMRECEPWQFSLRREDFGRVHGLWVGLTFFPIWIDHEHKLYPS